ncbi:MAG: terpene cyclase/mutase family protein [Planctomycetes bacterium]|nr:terpene cyclase/mutase family protein [Planctomycetota bacterium]
MMLASALLLFSQSAAAEEPVWSEWRYAMPFAHSGGAAVVGTAHAPEEGLLMMGLDGEGPDLTASLPGGLGDEDLRWERFQVNAAPDGWFDTGRIDFLRELKVSSVSEACAYMYRSVRCARDTEVPVTLGSDDSLRIWLNGEIIHEFIGGRGLNIAEDEVTLPLKAGKNHILVKVVQSGGAWGFGARSVDYLHTGDRLRAQGDINEAIDRGVDWLIGAQLRDGSWPFEQHRFRNGQTGLVLYALLKSGVKSDHPAIQRGFAFLEGQMPRMTYSAGCELLALASLPGSEGVERMEEIVDLLFDWERRGFGYPEGEEDLSNTQYAALGFLAAASKGIKIPTKSWQQLVLYTLNLADGEGGFGYRPSWEANGSMTSAGLTVLSLSLMQLGEKGNLAGAKRREARRAIDDGIEWFAKNFSREHNPHGGQRWHPYYLYGIERVCAIEKIDMIGEHPWYWEGASWFVTNQNPDGTWLSGGDVYFQTSFALLFLSRATQSMTGGSTHSYEDLWWTRDAAAEVRLRATGDTPMTVWLDDFGEEFVGEHEGVRVAKVEYLVGGELVGVVVGDVSRKWDAEKYAIRHSFPKNGQYEVIARVHYVPGLHSDAAGVQTQTVDSPPLGVSVDEVAEDWMLASAEGDLHNLMPEEGFEVSATSVNMNGQEPAKALDRHEFTAWFCAADDLEPTLTVAIPRAVRANRVIIAQAPPNPLNIGKADYAQRVSLRINKTSTRYEVTAPQDRRAPTVIDLGKDVRIKHMEVFLIDRVKGTDWPGRAGVNELQLQYVEKDGSLRERRKR